MPPEVNANSIWSCLSFGALPLYRGTPGITGFTTPLSRPEESVFESRKNLDLKKASIKQTRNQKGKTKCQCTAIRMSSKDIHPMVSPSSPGVSAIGRDTTAQPDGLPSENSRSRTTLRSLSQSLLGRIMQQPLLPFPQDN